MLPVFYRLLLLSTTLACVLLIVPAVQAHPASGIVVDRSGNVYFSDLESVWKIDSKGRLTIFRAGVRGRHVHELSIDNDDNIYGADISYEAEKWVSSVWRMSPGGEITYLLRPTTDPPAGMSIWRDSIGNMYWVDQNNHTKTQTLLVRRTPAGVVTTLAGGAYGRADGSGAEARFGSIGGMTVGPDSNIYLTDGAAVRRVTMDGSVSTIAEKLGVRTSEDTPTLFSSEHGSLAGLTVGGDGTVYVADSGNRRVLRIARGKVDVVLRSEPPFFPTGAFVSSSGDVYVLEVGLTLPNLSSGPRVRRVGTDGTITHIVTLGEDRSRRSVPAVAFERAGIIAESILQSVYEGKTKFVILALVLVTALGLVRFRRKVRKA